MRCDAIRIDAMDSFTIAAQYWIGLECLPPCSLYFPPFYFSVAFFERYGMLVMVLKAIDSLPLYYTSASLSRVVDKRLWRVLAGVGVVIGSMRFQKPVVVSFR